MRMRDVSDLVLALCWSIATSILSLVRAVLLPLPAMPKTKSTRGRQRKQQNPVRRSTRPSTQASSRATAAPAPRGTVLSAQPQPDPLVQGTLTNLLDLIRDQVRAEIQAQQTSLEATTTPAGQPTVTGTTGQQATTGQATATTSQADPTATGAGMLIWVKIIYDYCK